MVGMGKLNEWVRGHAWLSVAIALFVGVAIGSGTSERSDATNPVAAEKDSPSSESVQQEQDESEPGPEESEAAPEPEPEPEEPEIKDGKFGLASCDLHLDFDNPQLLGSTEIANSGNVPIDVEITFKWLMGDGSKLEAESKVARVAVNKDKLVFFKVPITTDQVSLFQNHPKYYDSDNCKTNATIK